MDSRVSVSAVEPTAQWQWRGPIVCLTQLLTESVLTHVSPNRSAFTVEDPPKLTFRLWSKFRPSVVFIYRSTDKQYALKHVECVKMSSRVGELDGYAATGEILCEAKALEHLEASAPALSGVLFPPYLGLWTSAGDRTLFGLMTTWFGEPVEPCSLEYLHRFAFSSYFTDPDAQP